MKYELPEIDMNKPVWKMYPEKAFRVQKGRCTSCDKLITSTDEFEDELSIKEYSISGLCMDCQRKVFG